LIRFNAPDPIGFVEEARRRLSALPATERVRACLAAHAPYSVAPRIFRAISEVCARDGLAPWSVHLSESAQEVEFIMTGEGAWRDLLEEIGAWDAAWVAPRVSPVEYVDSTGFLDSRALAVHGVQMSRRDLERVAARGATLVTCPRSNRYTGAGDPPIGAFYDAGIPVAVGTDSLASAPDLNVFAELAAMRALAPAVPPSWLLDAATRQGARALGVGDEYGTLTAGKRARMIAVAIPPGTNDVEEYLVSGIRPTQVRWVPGLE
jgi:cytosine/adenosine deaminase-related metal-dependent hydrolase